MLPESWILMSALVQRFSLESTNPIGFEITLSLHLAVAVPYGEGLYDRIGHHVL